MCVDESGKYDLAVEIENPVGGSREVTKNSGRLTNGCDRVLLDDDGAVEEDSAVGVHGDDDGVVKYRHSRVGLRIVHQSLSE